MTINIDQERELFEEAYQKGFLRAAEWCGRSDLSHDTESPAYIFDRDADLEPCSQKPSSRMRRLKGSEGWRMWITKATHRWLTWPALMYQH